MAERNVVKPYVPPYFDSSQIPALKKRKEGKSVVYIVVPIGMQCSACNNIIHKDGRVHAHKEECAEVEDYHEIRRWRFYFPCSSCSAEIVIKTNPENDDFECISGATRFDYPASIENVVVSNNS